MWSYHQTAVPATLATSSVSNAGSTTSIASTNVGRTASITAQNTNSSTGETMGSPTSWTYLNTTNTTQTVTTTYSSVRSSSEGLGTTVTTDFTGGFSTQTLSTTAFTRQEADTRTGSSVTNQGRSTTAFGLIPQLVVTNTTFVTSQWQSNITITSSAAGTRLTRRTSTGFTENDTFITSSTQTASNLGTTTTTTFVPRDSTSFSTASTLLTASATSSWIDTLSYRSGTSTFTTTANGQTTATATRASSFITSSTTTAGTDTLTITTTSSSQDPITTSATTTVSSTATTFATATFMLPAAVYTVVEMSSTEWGWSVTGPGSSRVEDVGASFTKTTFTAQGGGASFSVNTLTQTATTSITKTFSSTSYSSSTLSSTRSTTSQSTYRVAQSGTAVPFTDTTRIATLSYSSSTATTWTYSTSSTRTGSLIHFPDTGVTGATSLTDSVTTTFTGGTSISLLTYTRPTTTAIITAFNLTQSLDNGLGTTSSITTIRGVTGKTATASSSFSRDSSVSVSPPTANQITIGEGWQASTFGRLQSIGTNLDSVSTTTVSEVATAWPRQTVRVPVSDRGAFSIAGSVPQTRRNTRTTTKLGGYGWESTNGSTVSQSTGVHRATTNDSSTSGTIEKSWAPTASTLSLASGVALAVEPLPLVNTTSSVNGDSQFLTFSAFPST